MVYFILSGLGILCIRFIPFMQGLSVVRDRFLVILWLFSRESYMVCFFMVLCHVNGWFRGLFILLCMEEVIGSKRLPGFCRRVRGAGCRLAADRRGCRLRGGR